VSLVAFLRRPPSVEAAFAVMGALVVAVVLATFALVAVTATDVEQSAEPTDRLARLRHEATAAAVFDRQALLAPASEVVRATAEARAAQARFRGQLRAIAADSDFDPEQQVLYESAVRAWDEREALAGAAFAWPRDTSELGEHVRWQLCEALARATHAFNDRLQDLSIAFRAGPLRALRTLRLVSIALCGAALAIVAGGALFVRRTVLAPLRRLLAAEASVARGHLDLRVPTGGLAEVRELAFGFNEMVSALRARAEEVKQKQTLLGRRERALHRRNKELASANAELDAFAYAASHDLRAPLRSIESMARFLWEDVGEKLDPEARDKLDRIRRASRRLHQLIDSLFEVARAGRELGEVRDVPLGDCLDEALFGLQGAIREAGADIQIVSELPTVRGDRDRLVQVVQNLLGNAIKYSAGPDRTPRIEVGARNEEEGNVVALWVRDNGIGIPEDQHQRIFQLFRRLHREGEYEGTGVGLSIVQRAVHAHGGDVSVASVPGEGSCFTVRLPHEPPRARKEAA
jgi:signal transduction histidine kinase